MTQRMTQRMAINYVMDNFGDNLPTEVKEKFEAMLVALDKKSNRSGERKPTKTQVANEGFKEIILASMEVDRLYTITEMVKEFDFGEELSNQRVSALVRQLKEAGKVFRKSARSKELRTRERRILNSPRTDEKPFKGFFLTCVNC